ncbi:MAG: RsiV family protein, partial [Alloprevotella sp.]|nr:RsiV family protein [Alloprevotella sp.]
QSSTLNDFFEFTLPAEAPALKSDGVKFQYQAYEICCYAMGMPDCTIPYDEIRPMLTDYAKQLIAGIQKKD